MILQPIEIETMKHLSCGTKLRVYQPRGHDPVVYCPACHSPYLVDCRDVKVEDLQ